MPVTAQALAQTAVAVDCWSAEEAAAAHIQNLQSQLMIQALKCQDTLPAAVDSYNHFLAAKRPLIITNRRAVVAHFMRRYGPAEGPAALTDYETRLSNHNSAPTTDVAACGRTAAFARVAATATDEDLLPLADAVAGDVIIADCPAPAVRTAMVMPSWPQPLATRPAPAAGPSGYRALAAPAAAPAVAQEAAPVAEREDAYQTAGDADMAPAFARPERVATVDPRDGAPHLPPAAEPEPAAAAVAAPAATASQAETVAALRAAVAALDRVAGTLQPAGTAPQP